jgi:hypothetical protein
MLGMTALTSLIALAFCAESIFFRLMVKSVFSFGFSSAAGAASAVGAALEAEGAAEAGAA